MNENFVKCTGKDKADGWVVRARSPMIACRDGRGEAAADGFARAVDTFDGAWRIGARIGLGAPSRLVALGSSTVTELNTLGAT